MNQGKLEVVKQDMARVTMDILGISELKRTGMGEFNSVQFSHSVVSDSATPWIAARQASLSITISKNLTQMIIISTTVGRIPLGEME